MGEEGQRRNRVTFDWLVENAPPFYDMDVDEYIDTLALWLRDVLGIYTPDLLVALINELARRRDSRLKHVTARKVKYRLTVLAKLGKIKLRRV